MNEQLVKFIELCLVDGVITDKEREVIFRKSKELGVPEDECEIIIAGMLQQHIKNNSVSESSIETLPTNTIKEENKKTLNIIFKKSISKPLVIDTLNFLCDNRNNNEVKLKSTIQHYENLLVRDKEIYPTQESLNKEKQEIESKVFSILEKVDSVKRRERELEEIKGDFLDSGESLLKEAAEIVFDNQSARNSSSLIQRKLKIGYNRANRIIDFLEAAEIIGPFNGSKPRVIIPKSKKTLHESLNKFYEY